MIAAQVIGQIGQIKDEGRLRPHPPQAAKARQVWND
jgi:hypothetical protein